VSAFLIVYNRKGNPLEQRILTPMLDRISHRGPDGSDYLLQKNILISHHHLWITPEEYGEHQPLKSGSGNLIISFDGRIDNRDELAELSGLERAESKIISDASFVLKMYEVFGESCFDKIIGPHSTIIFDVIRNRIVGACDRLAERGFFYYVDNGIFVAASEESAILAHPGVPRIINKKTVSYFFAMEAPRDGSTFFEGINELSPASFIVVDEKNIQLKKYWEYKPKRIRYKNDIEYAEHYKELLEKSVISRMRCFTPISIMLSGGIDSSSLAALSAINNPNKENIKAISWTFDSLKECDERSYIEETCKMYDLKKVRFNADSLWPLHEPETYFQNPNTPIENPYRELKEYTYKLCKQNGSRLIFNGWYSDHYYAGYEYWLLDLYRDFKTKRFTSDLIWMLLIKGIFGIYKEPSFRKLFNFLKPLKRQEDLHERYSWLSDYAIFNIPQLLEHEKKFNKYQNPKKISKMFDTVSFFNPCSEFFHLSKHSVEIECPYRDIRLIEFILNIPSYELYNRGKMKYMAKQAMKKILPQSIIERSTPTLLTPLFNLGLKEKNGGQISDLLKTSVEWRRYVNKNWLEERGFADESHGREALVKWQCISFVKWLINLEKNKYM